jgi:hypothetical protein
MRVSMRRSIAAPPQVWGKPGVVGNPETMVHWGPLSAACLFSYGERSRENRPIAFTAKPREVEWP